MKELAKICSALLALIVSTPSLAASVLYGMTMEGQLVTVDVATGAATAIGAPSITNRGISDLAYDEVSQTLYGYDWRDDELIAIDRQTGTGTLVAHVGGGGPSLAIDADGTMYSHWSGYLERFDPYYGVFLRIGPASGPSAISFMTADTNTGTLYSTSQGKLYSFDSSSGAATLIAEMTSIYGSYVEPGLPLRAIAFDSSTDTLYGYNSGGPLFTIDTTTGVQNFIAPASEPLRAMAFAPAVVPIPAAVWLFGSGLGLLGWMRRKPAP